jgi:hypothetical protein
MLENLRSGLPVGDPVGAAGRTRRQHFLGHHEAFEVGIFAAAILFWPGHADEPGGRSAAAEVGIEG